jgi:hypothetical protein
VEQGEELEYLLYCLTLKWSCCPSKHQLFTHWRSIKYNIPESLDTNFEIILWEGCTRNLQWGFCTNWACCYLHRKSRENFEICISCHSSMKFEFPPHRKHSLSRFNAINRCLLWDSYKTKYLWAMFSVCEIWRQWYMKSRMWLKKLNFYFVQQWEVSMKFVSLHRTKVHQLDGMLRGRLRHSTSDF